MADRTSLLSKTEPTYSAYPTKKRKISASSSSANTDTIGSAIKMSKLGLNQSNRTESR